MSNRKARRDFFILDNYEAGIELKGTEVKSLRNRRGNLNDSFARVTNGEIWLCNFHISPWDFGNINNHDAYRDKKLLLHKKEINKLFSTVSQKGHSLIPLTVYLKRGKVKIELALCKGKVQYDKRETIKRKTAEREAERAIKSAIRSKKE
ncbi:MAG: SsrA-binding protein SmpB [Candidatus Theseobacter exili]|nr:SsrA-binding protein SmpB [Candidatus Theseobacter exili]